MNCIYISQNEIFTYGMSCMYGLPCLIRPGSASPLLAWWPCFLFPFFFLWLAPDAPFSFSLPVRTAEYSDIPGCALFKERSICWCALFGGWGRGDFNGLSKCLLLIYRILFCPPIVIMAQNHYNCIYGW